MQTDLKDRRKKYEYNTRRKKRETKENKKDERQKWGWNKEWFNTPTCASNFCTLI